MALAAATPALARERIHVRVMTYNVHSTIGWDRRTRPDRIAAIVAEYKPDIVALQEVRVGRQEPEKGGVGSVPPPVGEPPLPSPSVIPPRPSSDTAGAAPFADQPGVIAAASGLYRVFYPLVRMSHQDYGIAILSRYPMKIVRAQNLPTLPGRLGPERRGVIWVEIDVQGTRLEFIGTHLGLHSEERSRQVDALLGPDFLKDPKAKPPLILCGDFNSTPSGEPFRRISAVLTDAARGSPPEKRRTFISWLPVTRLDYVFLSEDIEATRVQVPRDLRVRLASDHLPVVVDLKF